MTALALVPTRRSAVLEHLPPNWYASVMGTGIVAVAAAGVPIHDRAVHVGVIAVWALVSAWFAVLLVLTAAHWSLFGGQARAYLRHPVIGHFVGAVPMAFLTIGSSTLLVGRDVIGAQAALRADVVLWSIGTVGGLATWARFLLQRERGGAFGGWLMPLVPPMVAASAGALLLGHAHGAVHAGLHAGCWVLFGLAIVPSAVVIVAVVRADVPPVLAPTAFIVLGPLGQSATAATLLAAHGWVYGVVALTFASAWAVVAGVRTVAARPAFGLPWWSFTFPVGTCVTGASAVSHHFAGMRPVAVVLFAVLVGTVAVVATATAREAFSGRLFRA